MSAPTVILTAWDATNLIATITINGGSPQNVIVPPDQATSADSVTAYLLQAAENLLAQADGSGASGPNLSSLIGQPIN